MTKEPKPFRGHKTQKQLAAYFGLLIARTIEQVNDQGIDTSGFLKLLLQGDLPTGVPLTKNMLYDLLLNLCPVYDEEGRKLSLSKMNIAEAAKFFEQCYNFLSSRGFEIPNPDPNWRDNLIKGTK
jgi:hypothetical protein